jgi:hypothetical protein
VLGGTRYFGVLSAELTSFHTSGASNFEMTPRFWGNL